jgi:hypothetical protein
LSEVSTDRFMHADRDRTVEARRFSVAPMMIWNILLSLIIIS